MRITAIDDVCLRSNALLPCVGSRRSALWQLEGKGRHLAGGDFGLQVVGNASYDDTTPLTGAFHAHAPFRPFLSL